MNKNILNVNIENLNDGDIVQYNAKKGTFENVALDYALKELNAKISEILSLISQNKSEIDGKLKLIDTKLKDYHEILQNIVRKDK